MGGRSTGEETVCWAWGNSVIVGYLAIVGVMLGLPFPGGNALEELANSYDGKCKTRICVKDRQVCLSGLENLCKKMYNDKYEPGAIAKFCIQSIAASVKALYENIVGSGSGMQTVFCGGVASNATVRGAVENARTVFAPVEYCTDNAVGTAVLTAVKEGLV